MSLLARRASLSPYVTTAQPTGSGLVGITLDTGVADSESTFGVHMPVYRSYTSGGVPASFASTPASSDWDSTNNVSFRTSVWSCKPNVDNQAAGSLDGDWTTFLNTIPDGHRIYITMQHEADLKVRNGTYTLSQWQAAWDEWSSFMVAYKAAHPAKHIKTYLCLTNGPWTYAPQTDPDDYYRGTFDCWAPDSYSNDTYLYANGSRTMADEIQYSIGQGVSYGLNKGSTSWGLPEWGPIVDSSHTDFNPAATAAAGQYMDATAGFAFATYFSINNNPNTPGVGPDVRGLPAPTAAIVALVNSHSS